MCNQGWKHYASKRLPKSCELIGSEKATHPGHKVTNISKDLIDGVPGTGQNKYFWPEAY